MAGRAWSARFAAYDARWQVDPGLLRQLHSDAGQIDAASPTIGGRGLI